MQPQSKPKHHKKKFGASIGLEKFATAKKSGYDKRAKQEKERALNAARVNAYKKLKKRLGDKLEPRLKLSEVRWAASFKRRGTCMCPAGRSL